MNRKVVIGLVSIMFLLSCVSPKNGLISIHKKKNINLSIITNQVRIGYETEKAIIYIGKQDAIFLTEKKLSNRKLDPRFDKIIINNLTSNLDTLKFISKDLIVKHSLARQSKFNLTDYNFAGFIDQWILNDLILKGKVEIWNKIENKYEKKIIYHFIRDQLGGEECYYTFENETEFHRQLIVLGE